MGDLITVPPRRLAITAGLARMSMVGLGLVAACWAGYLSLVQAGAAFAAMAVIVIAIEAWELQRPGSVARALGGVLVGLVFAAFVAVNGRLDAVAAGVLALVLMGALVSFEAARRRRKRRRSRS